MVGRAIVKYGASNFTFDLLITGIENQHYLDQCECYYIEAYSTLAPHGYNLLPGGAGLGRAGARGDRNGSRTHPERMARGDNHWTRMYPGRLIRGEHNHMAKLTDHQVHAIIYLYCRWWKVRRIAALFEVTPDTIRRILRSESRIQQNR
jgi:hypothetical protein